jgi:hypothetical protein
MHSGEMSEDIAIAEICETDFAFVYLDVDDPHVAWLAYRGLLNSCDISSTNPGNISWFLVDVIKGGLVSTLRREGVLEGFLLREFPKTALTAQVRLRVPNTRCCREGQFRAWTISGQASTIQPG